MPTEPEEVTGGELETELGQEPADDSVAGGAEETRGSEAANDAVNYEEIAEKSGWVSEDQYEGEEGTWVNAEEFVKRAPLFDKIKSQSKTIAKMNKTMEAMSKQFVKNSEAMTKKHMAELKEAKREAIEVGDVDKVEAIEKEMADTEESKVEIPELPQEISDFLDENSWYDKPGNEEMTRLAKAHNRACLDDGMPLKESLDEARRIVMQAFPEKFENRRKQTPPPVETNSKPTEKGDGSTRYTVSRLSADQKMVYNQMVKRDKILSHEEYFKSLEEIGELA